MSKPIAIAAMAENRAIGRQNQIPWRSSEDFKWFKATTTGHVLIMGRKTFESIGRPLPNRTTIVVSRSPFQKEGVLWADSIEQALSLAGEQKVFICGGAQIYQEMLPLCSDIYLTVMKLKVEDADAFFPAFEDSFVFVADIKDTPEFTVKHYTSKK